MIKARVEVYIVNVELKDPITWGDQKRHHVELVARRRAVPDWDGTVLQVELMRVPNGCEYQFFPMSNGNVITWSDTLVMIEYNPSDYQGYDLRFYKYVTAGNIGYLENEEKKRQWWIDTDGTICPPPE